MTREILAKLLRQEVPDEIFAARLGAAWVFARKSWAQVLSMSTKEIQATPEDRAIASDVLTRRALDETLDADNFYPVYTDPPTWIFESNFCCALGDLRFYKRKIK